ncbi:hypothetical protein FKM82_031073 [Ascaphus truei]
MYFGGGGGIFKCIWGAWWYLLYVFGGAWVSSIFGQATWQPYWCTRSYKKVPHMPLASKFAAERDKKKTGKGLTHTDMISL